MPTSPALDENWTKTTDAVERRKIQNRLAQRNYRNNIKQRLRQLDQLDKAISKSANLSVETLCRDENDDEDEGHQPPQQQQQKQQQQQQQQPINNTTTVYPVSQPLETRPDNNCSWLSHQNEIPQAGHGDIQMDMNSQMDPNQYMFGLITPHTTRSPSPQSQSQPQPQPQPQPQHLPQYNYFANPSPPQEQHASPTIGQAMLPLSGSPVPYHNRHISGSEIKPNFTGGLICPPTSHSPLPQSQAYRIPTPTNSEKGSVLSGPGPGSGIRCSSGTPLHQAAANGHLQIIRFLVLKGANLTAPNETGQTVLHLAAERGHEGVIEHVLTQGHVGDIKAFIDWVDDQGFTALHQAAAGGHEECVRILVEAGAEIESSNR